MVIAFSLGSARRAVTRTVLGEKNIYPSPPRTAHRDMTSHSAIWWRHFVPVTPYHGDIHSENKTSMKSLDCPRQPPLAQFRRNAGITQPLRTSPPSLSQPGVRDLFVTSNRPLRNLQVTSDPIRVALMVGEFVDLGASRMPTQTRDAPNGGDPRPTQCWCDGQRATSGADLDPGVRLLLWSSPEAASPRLVAARCWPPPSVGKRLFDGPIWTTPMKPRSTVSAARVWRSHQLPYSVGNLRKLKRITKKYTKKYTKIKAN